MGEAEGDGHDFGFAEEESVWEEGGKGQSADYLIGNFL